MQGLKFSVKEVWTLIVVGMYVDGDGAVRPAVYLSNLKQALATVQQYTVLTLGQNNVFNGSLTCNSNVTADIVANLPAMCKAPKLVTR